MSRQKPLLLSNSNSNIKNKRINTLLKLENKYYNYDDKINSFLPSISPKQLQKLIISVVLLLFLCNSVFTENNIKQTLNPYLKHYQIDYSQNYINNSNLHFFSDTFNNNILNSNIESASLYIHGDYDAVNALKFELNIKKATSRGIKYLEKGLEISILSQNFTHVCATKTFSLAAAENGDIIFNGLFGSYFGEVSFTSPPKVIWSVDVDNMGNISQLECGLEHAFVLTDKNQLYALGSGRVGQIGFGNISTQAASFTKHPYLENVVYVHATSYITVYIDNLAQAWISGRFSDSKYYGNFFSKYTPEKIIYNNNPLHAISVSASSNGVVIVSNDSCIYAYGLVMNSFTNYVRKLDIICDKISSFINFNGDIIISKTNSSTIVLSQLQGNEIVENVLFEHFEENIMQITAYDNLIALHLSNNTIVGYSKTPFFNLGFDETFKIIKMPDSTYNESSLYFNDSKYMRNIDCTDQYCIVLDQNKGVYTAGFWFSTCNINSSNLEICTNYKATLENEIILYVNPYQDEQNCRIGMFRMSRNNLLYYLHIVRCLDVYSTENRIDQVKYFYLPKQADPTSIVFLLDSKIYSTFSYISNANNKNLKLDLTKFNLNNINPSSQESNFISELNNLNDFQQVTTIKKNNSYFGIFHIAKGKYYGGLAIVEFDSKFEFRNKIAFVEKVESFWIRPETNYSVPYIIGIRDNCTIFTLSNIYYPRDPCIELKKFVTGILNHTALSSEGKIYNVNLLGSEYWLNEINGLNNEFFIHITMSIDDYLYALTKNRNLYVISPNGDIGIQEIEDITRIQTYGIIDSYGAQLYKGIDCYGVAADDFRVCNGHGICMHQDDCLCFNNYYGSNCTTFVEYTCGGFNPIYSDKVCSGHGKCIGQDICECTQDFEGKDCRCSGFNIINYCFDTKFINENFIIFFVIFVLLSSVCIYSLIFVISILFCLIVCDTWVIKRKEKIIRKKDTLLSNLVRDQELENLDEDKYAWELNKKHFNIEPSELELIKKIGSGGEGIVYLAKWRHLEVAVKYYNCKLIPKETIIESFKKESTLMASLRHPNIIQFLGATLSYPRVGFILEYAPSSVDKFIQSGESKKTSKEILVNMLLEVCIAMSYLHSNNIIHRDLKWQNVLLNQLGSCKITDFGLSRIDDSISTNLTKNIGTGFYIAPENFKGMTYDSKIDVYAFGLMIFELLCGTLNPWSLDESTKGLTITRIAFEASHNPSFRPNVEHLRKDFENFIPICNSCWNHDPSKRPTFEDLEKMLFKYLESLN